MSKRRTPRKADAVVLVRKGRSKADRMRQDRAEERAELVDKMLEPARRSAEEYAKTGRDR